MNGPYKDVWSRIVRRQKRLFIIILMILRHRQDAEEALQEALTKMHRAIKRGDRIRQLKPWSKQVARRTAIDFYRKRLRNRVRYASDLVAEDEQWDPPAPHEQRDAEILLDLKTQLSGLNSKLIDEFEVTAAEIEFSRACQVRRLQLAAIASLIADLPPLQAKMVDMKFVKGMLTDAIAKATGFDPENIRSNARRGLKTLTAQLERCRG